MNYWIVVAGPTQARVFSITGHNEILHFVRRIEPARTVAAINAPPDSSANGRASQTQPQSHGEKASDFAHEIIRCLDAGFHHGDFHLFTLVAPREFLDLLTRLLNPHLQHHLRKCVAEDYQALATEQLQPLVHTMLPNLALI